MTDPKIIKSRVVIQYEADDGYSSSIIIENGDIMPESALLDGLKELARLTALFGFEDQALVVFEEARKNVAQWKKDTGRA